MRNIFDELETKIEDYILTSNRNTEVAKSNFTKALRQPLNLKKIKGYSYSYEKLKEGKLLPLFDLKSLNGINREFIKTRSLARKSLSAVDIQKYEDSFIKSQIDTIQNKKMELLQTYQNKISNIKTEYEKEFPADPTAELAELEKRKAEAFLLDKTSVNKKMRDFAQGKVWMSQAEAGLMLSQLDSETQADLRPTVKKAIEKLPPKWHFKNSEKIDDIVNKINSILQTDPGAIPLKDVEGKFQKNIVNIPDLFNDNELSILKETQKEFADNFLKSGAKL